MINPLFRLERMQVSALKRLHIDRFIAAFYEFDY